MKHRKKCYESVQIYGIGRVETEFTNKRIDYQMHEKDLIYLEVLEKKKNRKTVSTKPEIYAVYCNYKSTTVIGGLLKAAKDTEEARKCKAVRYLTAKFGMTVLPLKSWGLT
jgi:hypothetical protein